MENELTWFLIGLAIGLSPIATSAIYCRLADARDERMDRGEW